MYKKLSRSNQKGFTLLELLIVIAIIAILSVILILVLDPAETLRKSRDSQRIADLNTLKTALGIFTVSTSTGPYLGGATANTSCKTSTTSGGTYTQAVSRVWYGVGNDVTAIASGTTALVDGVAGSSASGTQASSASSTLTNGQGWVPVNFDQLVGGSPISNLPLDPTNNVTAAQPVNADLTYRYTCNSQTIKWEADATLESTAFTVQDNKMSKDGGNNNSVYEIGTDLKLLGSTNTF